MKKLKKILNSKISILAILIISLIRPLYIIFNINNPKTLPESNQIEGTITDYYFNSNSLTIVINNTKCYYYFNDYNQYLKYKKQIKYGLKLKLDGNYELIKKTTIPGNFNNNLYQSLQNKHYQYIISDIKIIHNENFIYSIKNHINNFLNKYKYSEYYQALILGNKHYLNNNLTDIYQFNGISHLLAISGTHLSIYLFIINCLLKRLKIPIIIRFIVNSIFILLLLFLTNYTTSLLRAGIFYLLIKIDQKYHIFSDIKTILLYTFIIIILINPSNIYNLGFIYSILCIYVITSIKLKGNYIVKMLKISTYTLLITLPLTIYLNHQINILSILINIIMVPLMSFIIIPLMLISIIIPSTNNIFVFLINIFNSLNIFFSNIKFLNIIVPQYPIYLNIIYYLLLILNIKTNKKIYIILIIILIMGIKIYPRFNNQLSVTYLDVSQGDSTILITPYQKTTIMIDTGGIRSYTKDKYPIYQEYHLSKKIINFLHSKGISKIKYLIITHGDFDHMGETINLVNNFKVENVIFNCGTYNDLEKELIKVLDKNKIKYYSCIKELNIDKYKLQFLNTKEYDNENDNSNVVYFNYEGYKFLFMGDVGIEKEKDILEKYNISNIDFIKIGHHGSNTSSSEHFINSVNPKNSLISVGKNNRYGHPKDEVLDTLKNSKIYRTDLDGSIEIKLNKNGYNIRTCPS